MNIWTYREEVGSDGFILDREGSCNHPRMLLLGGLFRLFWIPAILLASYSVFAASIAIGFLSATLEPHLRPVGLLKFYGSRMTYWDSRVFTSVWTGTGCDGALVRH